jgi:hypothetical protein
MSSRRRALTIGGVLALCAAVPALAAGSGQAVHARLAPAAPASHGSGAFTATGGQGNTVVVRWNLSVSGLTGPARKASLRTAGSPKISFALCSPCKAKSHGQLVLLGSVWNRIVAKGGTVVVATRAHPAGELRGALKRS